MRLGKSIKGALSYNEKKVREDNAELILASRFGREISEMGFTEKLNRFEKLTSLREKNQTNTLHLSLNFSNDDHLDTETMQKIATDYMERIGFGHQPYLVYMHKDAAHPHLHIVAPTIQPNGNPIYLHNLGKLKSEPARKALEIEYGLIKAETRKKQDIDPLRPVCLEPGVYGESETKRVITNIVLQVVSQFKFSTFDEFNAILRNYNIIADRGHPHSKMFQANGLMYSLLDKEGFKTGVSIKSSSIYTSPTLSFLEKKFQKNKIFKQPGLDYIKKTISRQFLISNNAVHFKQALLKNNIRLSASINKQGDIQSLYFIDIKRKTVFSNADINLQVDELKEKFDKNNLPQRNRLITYISNKQLNSPKLPTGNIQLELVKHLFMPEYFHDTIDQEFLKKRKRKKKK
ncbi:MAG: relaxase/mobilization nuclease domain-containing protein [Sphingobacteriales bacterium]|nr:relaxase/mobilization nuclease domain-containing protein [Sphingobacteriales bacterium]